MKSRETLIRLKKFQVDEKRRRVAQIEGMIADFQRMTNELEREIQTEQDRAGIEDDMVVLFEGSVDEVAQELAFEQFRGVRRARTGGQNREVRN